MKIITTKAPARLELLGHHLDYNGGTTLASVFPIYDTIILEQVLDGSNTLYYCSNELQSVAIKDFCNASICEIDHPIVIYALAVYKAIKEYFNISLNFGSIRLSTKLNIPYGAGLGSSAALCIALIKAFSKLYDLNILPRYYIDICLLAENKYINNSTGMLDPYAITYCKSGIISTVDAYPKSARLELPKNNWRIDLDRYKFVIFNLGERHNNSIRNKELGKLVFEHKELNDIVQQYLGTGKPIGALNEDKFDKLQNLEIKYKDYIRRIYNEKQIVDYAIDLFNNGKMNPTILGELMKISFQNARDYLHNCTQLQSDLYDELNTYEGIYGIKMHGAGFGGIMLGLINNQFWQQQDKLIRKFPMLKII